jgi:hypothetical protein
VTYQVDCEQCGKSHARLVERTNPRDYSVMRLRLCTRCRDKAGLNGSLSEGTGRVNRYAIPNKTVL